VNCFYLLALILSLSFSLNAKFTPMQADKFLVAGSSDKGYRDGEFWKAAFNDPRGIALAEDGKVLYVGDVGNRAIRTVELSKNNEVSTRFRFSERAPLDAAELVVLGGSIFFTPSDGRGLWRLGAGSQTPELLAGSTLTAGTTSSPIYVSPFAKVLWLSWGIPGGARLMSSDATGVTRNVTAAIEGLLPWDGSRLTALDQQLYVVRPTRQLVALNIALGLSGALNVEPGKEPLAALSPTTASLASLDYVAPADGKGCFFSWDKASSGVKLSYPSGLTTSVVMYDQLGHVIGGIPANPSLEPLACLDANTYPWLASGGLTLGGHSVYDPVANKMYICDNFHRHIVGWAWPYKGEWVYYYYGPPLGHKDPNVKTLLVVCDSLISGIATGTPQIQRQSMWKQFELQYNMLNALAGTGERYTVPLKGGSSGITWGATTYSLNNLDEYTRIGADEVLLNSTSKCNTLPKDLCWG
jgi:hypothetical protein